VRSKLRQNIDPLAEKQAARARAALAKAEAAKAVSFAQAVEHYIEAHQWGGAGDAACTTGARARSSYAVPVFGSKPVGKVTTEDVLKALTPIWTTKPILAARVRNRIEMVLDYSKAHDWRSGENPAARARQPEDAVARAGEVPHRRTPRGVVVAGGAWADGEAAGGHHVVWDARLRQMAEQCLAFVMLTACRSGEARGATWDEIDIEQKLWVIPAKRTKTAKLHRVPLSEPAVAMLRALHAERTESSLVFLGRYAGHLLCDLTLSEILRRHGHADVTVHGMRSTFRDWCNRSRPAGRSR
jgi:integrase